MKNFNFLSNLWSSVAGSQRNDVEFDRRLTVGSPSGFTINWTLKLVSVLVLVLSLGIGNAWGETITLTQSALELTGSYTTNTVKTVSNVDFTYTDLMKSNSNIQAKASSGKIYNSSLVPGKITKVQITSTGTGRSTTIAMGTSTSDYTAGNYTGNGGIYLNGPDNTCCGYFKITRGSNAAYWTQVVVTYTPATITLSKSSITGLNYAVGGGPSAAQTFTVSGSNIPANLTVTAPTNFEVSLDGSSWASSKTINVTLTGSASAGTLSSTTVYVRLASGKSAGNYSGNVSIAMAGCKTISSVNPKTVAVSGTVSAASYTVGWSITEGGGTLSTTSGISTTVTPTSGWRYASPAYTVLTGAASVFQSTNTFSATPTANSTIRINMEEIPSHSIHFNTGGLVEIADATGILEGATYNITQDPSASLSDGCEYSTFVGWTTASSIADASVKPSIVTSITMSTSDVTLYAVYSKTEGSGGDKYTKVTATGDIEDGQYLIVNETASRAFNGGLATGSIDANSNYISVTITSSEIGVTSTTEAAEFTIDATNGYIQAADGFYIGSTNNANELLRNATDGFAHTLSIDANEDFVAATTYTTLRYNKASGTERFRYYKSGQEAIQLYKKSSGTTTYSLNPSCDGPTITVSKTSIDFGDVKVGGSYTETFTVSGENLTGDINLAVSGAQAGKYSVSPTTLSPTAGTVAETTITVTFAPTASSDHAAQVDVTSDGATPKTVNLHAYSKWEVNWKNNGVVCATTLVAGGTKPAFPDTPTSCDTEESNLFYGWTDSEWSGKIDDVSAKTIHKSNASMAQPTNNNTIYYAVFVKRTGSVTTTTDNLTRETTGVEEGATSYSAWSDKTSNSDAVYAGNSAGDHNSIQLRSNNSNSGIVTTTSGGKAKKVTVVWNSNTADGRIVDIYGKSAAYTAATDLYGTNEQKGTKIGSIVYGTSTELTIDDDYAYIGIRSNSGALYLTSISIDWRDGEYSYSKYMTNCCDYYIAVAEPTKTGTGTVTFSSGGSAVAAGSDVATCAGTTTITATVTPTPGHRCDAISFSGGDVSVTIPDPFVPFTGATNYTLTFAQNTNATLETTVTFTQLQDKYYDYMHGNTTTTKSGNYGAAPSLSSEEKGDGCTGSHYKFIGWIPESDMNMETGEPTTTANMVAGGATGKYATGTNYYAIWAEEVEP